MRRMRLAFIAASIASTVILGCFQTKSEVDVKPVDINLNITGRLEVVITDARQQEEVITGSKPKRIVRPEDIGLPAAQEPASDNETGGFVFVADSGKEQLIQQLAARHPQIEAMRNSQLVGESHTGLLVPKAALSSGQQSLVDAENSDRTELYKQEAAKKNIPVDQAALGYYMARLEHVDKGNWVERFNKATGSWEWFQWDR
jgi:uncharacterized protein YdbL (DUF1318 family)